MLQWFDGDANHALDVLLRILLGLESPTVNHARRVRIHDICRPGTSLLVDVGATSDETVVVGIFVEAAHFQIPFEPSLWTFFSSSFLLVSLYGWNWWKRIYNFEHHGIYTFP